MHRVCVSHHHHRLPSPLPPRSTRGRAQKGRRCQAQHMALSLGTTEVKAPAGPFSFLQGCAPPYPSVHTLSAHSTRTSGGWGEHTVAPRGRNEATGTVTPQSYAALLPTSRPLLQATSSTCDTTDSLMPHYPYTSPSPVCAAPPPALFPDVASKLGHEHDTRGHVGGRR